MTKRVKTSESPPDPVDSPRHGGDDRRAAFGRSGNRESRPSRIRRRSPACSIVWTNYRGGLMETTDEITGYPQIDIPANQLLPCLPPRDRRTIRNRMIKYARLYRE